MRCSTDNGHRMVLCHRHFLSQAALQSALNEHTASILYVVRKTGGKLDSSQCGEEQMMCWQKVMNDEGQ